VTFDATDRKAIKRREKQAKQQEAQRLNYTRHIMADRFGREWMHDLLERCHIGHTAFIPEPSSRQTDFALGEQNIGLQVWADLMIACPQDYALMMSEAQTRNLANDRRDDNNRSPGDEHPGSEDSGRDAEGSISGVDYDPYARDPDPLN